MANRDMYPLRGCMEADAVLLPMTITAAADVAANGYSVSGRGVSSVTRTAEGVMRITLQDTYRSLLGIAVENSRSGSRARVTAEDVDGAGTVDVTFEEIDIDFTGSTFSWDATDPDGATIRVTLVLEN